MFSVGSKRVIIGFSLIFNLISRTYPLKNDVDNIVRLVNSLTNNSWKAGRNFNPGTLKNVSHLMGVLPRYKLHPTDILSMKAIEPPSLRDPLPVNYNVSSKWSACKSVLSIRDQSNCGSCWALSTASAFGDRLCITSNTTINKVLSGEYINSCCNNKKDGCNGGHPEKAWKYIKKKGLCTGGEYGSNEGCQPYSIVPCPRYKEYCLENNEATPQCSMNKCTNNDYGTSLSSDLYYAEKVYSVRPKPEIIMNEIYTNGPVVSAMRVFDDFLYYESGIYQYTVGRLQGDHAVKLIGWGQEDGINYWLCANTWGTSWGMRGIFKIRRGNNECGIESRITGGLPKL